VACRVRLARHLAGVAVFVAALALGMRGGFLLLAV
jgi:hypothetical protein